MRTVGSGSFEVGRTVCSADLEDIPGHIPAIDGLSLSTQQTDLHSLGSSR